MNVNVFLALGKKKKKETEPVFWRGKYFMFVFYVKELQCCWTHCYDLSSLKILRLI